MTLLRGQFVRAGLPCPCPYPLTPSQETGPGWNDDRTGFTLLTVQRLVISDSVWEAFCSDVDNAPLPRPDDAGIQDAITGATLTADQVASHRELNRRVRTSDPARY